MLKNISKRKKKKGFTLIELVIVLAVLAIIALIAIPNFTRVRNNAVTQADNTSAEQITNIVQTTVAEGILNPVIGGTLTGNYTITLGFGTNGEFTPLAATGIDNNLTGGTTITTAKLADFNANFIDVKAPQTPEKTGYIVNIDKTNGRVTTGLNP